MELPAGVEAQELLERFAADQAGEGEISRIDGIKIDYPDQWVNVRRSNTEPIIRIYTEAPTQAAADALADSSKALISSYLA